MGLYFVLLYFHTTLWSTLQLCYMNELGLELWPKTEMKEEFWKYKYILSCISDHLPAPTRNEMVSHSYYRGFNMASVLPFSARTPSPLMRRLCKSVFKERWDLFWRGQTVMLGNMPWIRVSALIHLSSVQPGLGQHSADQSSSSTPNWHKAGAKRPSYFPTK